MVGVCRADIFFVQKIHDLDFYILLFIAFKKMKMQIMIITIIMLIQRLNILNLNFTLKLFIFIVSHIFIQLL
jgi:hypothetical protein